MSDNSNLNSIGIRIKQLREKIGLTQGEFAEKMHTTRQTVAKWETGRQDFKTQDIIRMADIFHVTTDYLLGCTGNSLNIDEIKNMSVYTKLSDAAIYNLETIFTISYKIPAVERVFIPVPLTDVCNNFLSSDLFIELIKRLAELNAQSELCDLNGLIALEKESDTCSNLNISMLNFPNALSLLEKDCNPNEIYGHENAGENLEKLIETEKYLEMKLNDNCDLTRYRVLSMVEEINNKFDHRN